MDITPDNSTTQPISDDQELAKALAGVLPDDTSTNDVVSGMQFEETAVPSVATPPADTPAPEPAATDVTSLLPPLPDPSAEEPSAPVAEPTETTITAPTNSSELESIKSDALNELRPLIGHVDLSPEEKFDAYLMLIRSTDDSTLIAPAHKAAQNISDEKRKAEALLDIIKEIDYLSKKDSITTV